MGNNNDIKLTITAQDTTAAAFKRAEASVGGLEKKMATMAAGMQASMATAAAAIAGIATGKMVGTITEFEKLNASLKTITGSSANAKSAMGFLQEFAAKTPYQLQEVTQAFTKLSALGLTPSREAMESYGNTASAMGKGLNQMIEAVADASTGEFERLKEFGIKAKSKGDKVSFTFQGVSTTIGKNAAEIEQYLMKIGQVQFAGAMADQMDTLGGKLSNLGDTWDALLVSFGDSGIRDALKWTAEVGIDALELLKGAAQGLPKVFVSLFAGIEKGWEHVSYAFAVVAENIKSTWYEVIDELKKVYAKFLEMVASGLDYVPGAGSAAGYLHKNAAAIMPDLDRNMKDWDSRLASLKTKHQQTIAQIDETAMASFAAIDKTNSAVGKYEPALKKAAAATSGMTTEQKKLAEQMGVARREWEQAADLASLSGLDKELLQIGQAAEELRKKWGEQAEEWIGVGQAMRENAAIQADYLEKQTKNQEEFTRATEAYNEAVLSSLPEEQQAVAKVAEEYRKKQIAVMDAHNLGVISAEVAAAKSEEFSMREITASTAAVDALRDKADTIKDIWKHTYDNLQDITADWLYDMKISWTSLGDLFWKMVSQMVAAWAWGQASMAFAMPGTAAVPAAAAGTAATGTAAATGFSLTGAIGAASNFASSAYSFNLIGSSGAFLYEKGLETAGSALMDVANWLSDLPVVGDLGIAGIFSAYSAFSSFAAGDEISGLAHTAATIAALMGSPLIAAGIEALTFIGTSLGLWGGSSGGPSVGGTSWSTGVPILVPEHTAHQEDAAMLQLAEITLSELTRLAAELGGSAAGLVTGIGFSSDPAGDAPSYLHGGITDEAGNYIYSAYREVGRSEEELIAALDLATKQSILAALQSLQLNEFVDPILDKLDIGKLTASTADEALLFVESADQIIAAMSLLGVSAAELSSGLFDASLAGELLSGEVWAALTDAGQLAIEDALKQAVFAFNEQDLAGGAEYITSVTTAIAQIAAGLAPIQEIIDTNGLSETTLGLRAVSQEFASLGDALQAAGIDLQKYTQFAQAQAIVLQGLVASAGTAYLDGLIAERDTLQSNVDTARTRYLDLLVMEHESLDLLNDTLGDSINSIRQARAALYTQSGALLPGEQQLNAIKAEIERQQAVIAGGDPEKAAEALSQIQGLTGEYLAVSQGLRTDWRDVARDVAYIDNLLNATEQAAMEMRSEAQLELDRFDTLIATVEGAAQTAMTLDQARQQYEQAVYDLESSGFDAQIDYLSGLFDSSVRIETLLHDFLETQLALFASINLSGGVTTTDQNATLITTLAAVTAGKTEQWVADGDNDVWQSSGGAYAVKSGAEGNLYAKTGDLIGTGQEVIDWVSGRIEAQDAMAVYNGAVSVGLSSASLEKLMGWDAGSVNAWADTQNLQHFATGGSFMASGPGGVDNLSLPGLRVSAGEMVHVSRPDTMAGLRDELRQLREEVKRLRDDNNRGHIATATHSEKTASVMRRIEDGDAIRVRIDDSTAVKVEVTA